MSNKHFELNRTTKMLARIFPALLMLTPIVVGAATIDQSTSAPQDFSADSEYVINRDVTVSSADNTPAVSVSGMNVEKVTNEGNISGAGIGLDINIDAQSVEINNNENAIISSATDNAVNVQSMAGTFNNSGIITGANNGIFVSEESSAISITNTDTGVITGKNGLSSQIGVGLDNSGAITGTAGDGIALSDGNSKINNSGTVQGSENGINVVDSAKADIINSGLLGGGGTAVMFASSKNNSLVLNTGSSLIGDVISTGSTGNTLSLVGSGTEDSNFVGLHDGDGFASVKMNGEAWTLTGNLDIIGSGNVEKVDANTLTLTGTNSYTGNTLLKSGTTLVAEGATLGVADSDATITIENGAQFASAGEVNNNIDILSGGILAAWNAVEGNATLRTSGVDTINGNVTNSGTLLLSAADNSVGNNFTINGDYTGSAGSQIVMNSTLGEDSSPTDHLSITGSSYGQSGVSIANIGGLGAQTVNGMEIVSVSGSSEAQLTLSKPVVAGAYEYGLYQHDNGNWYLESKATPSDDPSDDTDDGDSGSDSGTDGGSGTDIDSDNGSNTDNGGQSAPEVMAPEVGAYLGNYLAAQSMFLHKRDDRDQLTFRNEDNLNTWMYVKGRYHENDAGGDKVSYDTTTTVLQVGSDFMSKPMDKGILRAGGMFGAGQAKTDSDAKHNVRDAQGKVDGFNVGLYATWQEDPKLRLGSYIDTWASYSWYNNTVTSNRNNEKYDSKGFAASVEVGHAWVIPSDNARTWKIEPQAQMIYSYLDQENHTDPDGVRVTTVDNNSLFGRLGVKSSYFEQHDVKAWQPYVAVNWLKGAGQNDLAFNGEKVSNDTPDDRGQLELGVTGNVNETTTISLRASGEWGENSYAAYGGHILLNHRW
ncbi:autotransporter family protein [Klebsiella aerogenes]|uniref:autotransporter family protein n=1 Tax=Klebsiella aerogenes TaxID=548 RepID=UPI000AD9B8CC|nr:autotransporter outer membrane beta-barrel domain-containing protein [Klebsiella aerogenes]